MKPSQAAPVFGFWFRGKATVLAFTKGFKDGQGRFRMRNGRLYLSDNLLLVAWVIVARIFGLSVGGW